MYVRFHYFFFSSFFDSTYDLCVRNGLCNEFHEIKFKKCARVRVRASERASPKNRTVRARARPLHYDNDVAFARARTQIPSAERRDGRLDRPVERTAGCIIGG